MIRLPSFFKRKTQSDDLEAGSVGRRSTKRAAPRAFQRALESEELALTEDPEQQRARHRLIGATVLVLIAVVGLPRILDNKPKAVSNDIAVNIVTSLPTPVPDPKPEPKAEEKARVETKQEVPAEVPKVVAPAPEAKAEAKPPALGLAAGEEVVATASNAKAKVDNPAKTADSVASKTNVKYIIPVGTFETEENVKNVTTKLKESKIPYAVYTKTKSDGVKQTAFRAGPFTDRDAAEAALKKIKALNPTAKIVESAKQ
ncbi:SPOR domain-containing protein [Polynucleobacter sp. MWH-UH23A]|uniref:SPOR domain-containing protein n=1 Tax=Polynucleobacter sp. MWH-UH23A TaxID=1855613 RepID=UPI003364F5B3